MGFYLICVEPFRQYQRGDMVTDQAEVAKLSVDREHHFVRIAAPDDAPPDAPPPQGGQT